LNKGGGRKRRRDGDAGTGAKEKEKTEKKRKRATNLAKFSKTLHNVRGLLWHNAKT
jgi:hypothetical protein